jgi:hypothetical protein
MVTIFLEGDVKFTVNYTLKEIQADINEAMLENEFIIVEAETIETGTSFMVCINPYKIIFMR